MNSKKPAPITTTLASSLPLHKPLHQAIQQVLPKPLAVSLLLTLSLPVAAAPVPSAFELSTLDSSNGFVINGRAGNIIGNLEKNGDRSGSSVSHAGDINGDGFDDVIIGAPGAYPNYNNQGGATYLVFGSNSNFTSPLEAADLDGSNGIILRGVSAGDKSGTSVSSAGDINGDGVDDLIIGAPSADANGNSNAGASYVVFGSSTTAFTTPFNLNSLNGSNGFVINGVAENDRSGISVSAAGDINNDDVDDLIIGADGAAPNGNGSGASYVVFGSNTTSFPASFDLSTLDGSNGFVINGADFFNRFGGSVSAAGDFNSDGVDDVIIGAVTSIGTSYVVFGSSSSSAFSTPVELDSLNGPGNRGAVIEGRRPGDLSGYSVSTAGDINGDGIDDVIIGAPGVGSHEDLSIPAYYAGNGASYIVFGNQSPSAFTAPLSLGALDGDNGFVLNGASFGDRSGNSVSAAGDLNGDGIDDLIIGAAHRSSNGDESGAGYVVFGKHSSSRFPPVLELFQLDGNDGYVINGVQEGDRSGTSVSAAGDINGDGISDLLVGAWRADPNGKIDAGSSYVVFMPVPDVAEPNNDVFSPTPLEMGAPQSHNIAPKGDRDFFTFTIDSAQIVVIETYNDGSAQSYDTVLELTLPDGTFVTDDNIDLSAGNRYSRIKRLLSAGDYQVEVYQRGNNGVIPSYGISVKSICNVSNPELKREVTPGEFVLLSLPCDPPTDQATIADVLADDIPGAYGTSWILFRYDESLNNGMGGYFGGADLDINQAKLRAGEGFWLVHTNSDPVVLDLPDDSTVASLEPQESTLANPACSSTEGCYVSTLEGSGNATSITWQLLGNPFPATVDTNDQRLIAESGMACLAPSGCDFTAAASANITAPFMWGYDETLTTPNKYVQVGPDFSNSVMQTWAGAWVGGWEHGQGAKLYWPLKD